MKDILIVGAGPVGLYGWKLAKELGLTGSIIDSHSKIGGQITSSYPNKLVKNLPIIGNIKGSTLIENLYTQAKEIDGEFDLFLGTRVTKVDKIDDGFNVTFNNNETAQFKKIILSCGFGEYLPNKLIEEDYSNLDYIPLNSDTYKDKDVVIFGGGDSAADIVLSLTDCAKSISWIHRRDEFRTSIANITKAKESGVNVLTPYSFDKVLLEDNNEIKSIQLKSNNSDELKELNCDTIIAQLGQKISLNTLEEFDVKLEITKRIKVDNNCQSSNEGIYAAGDSAVYEAKARNMLFGFQEIARAIIHIEMIVHQRKVMNNGWNL